MQKTVRKDNIKIVHLPDLQTDGDFIKVQIRTSEHVKV
jgi:hypothetical protein